MRIIFILLLLAVVSFGKEVSKVKYNYSFDNPETLVESFFLMLKNNDYTEMLKITDLYEKKRVEKILTELSNDSSLYYNLKYESSKMKKFEIINKEVITNEGTNEFIIITTLWYLSNDNKKLKNSDIYEKLENNINPKQKKKDNVVYVEYLLKKIDDQWKIISKRSK